MIDLIIFTISAGFLSILGIIFLLYNREKFVIDYFGFGLIFLYLINEITFCILFNLSFEIIIEMELAEIFWKISIILRILKLILLSSIHSFVLLGKKFNYIPSFFYVALAGIIGSLLMINDSFNMSIINNHYIFAIDFNDLLFFVIILFNLIIIFATIYFEIIGSSRISHNDVKILFHILSIHFIINISLYISYFIFPFVIFKYLYSIMFLSFLGMSVVLTIIKFELFVVVTNKIHDFVLFHRSGVLLYSYNFQENKEIEDSVLKGSILIGINHVLSNLVNKKNILNIIKMKDRDIIFEYNNEYGYALLIIVDHRSKIIQKSAELFMKEFSNQYKEILKKINENKTLIDVSQFKKTKEIMTNIFNPFLSVKS